MMGMGLWILHVQTFIVCVKSFRMWIEMCKVLTHITF